MNQVIDYFFKELKIGWYGARPQLTELIFLQFKFVNALFRLFFLNCPSDMTSYNSLETSLLNKRPAPTLMSHNMSQSYHQNQAMNFPYNNFSMQQYHAGYFREDQNKNYNTTTVQDPDEFLSEPTKKIKSEKNSEYSYPNGNPTFPYSQINNSQVNNQNNQLKTTMQNMMYQNQNFQDHLASTNQKTWESASSGLNSADQRSMTAEKPAPKPEANPAFSGEGQMAAFQQNSMIQNQYAQAMMAKYYSSFQNSAQAAQYKLYMQQQQQKYMNSNPYMNMAQAQQAQLYWAQQMKNMNAQRQAYQNLAANSSNSTTETSTNNSAQTQPQVQAQIQAQVQAQALNNQNVMQFFKDQNKSQGVEAKPQAQVQMRNTNMADLAAKGIHISINGASSKSEKQSTKNIQEEPEYKNSKNHSSDFPEEDKTTMISPTSFQVQDTNKIEGTAPAPIFDDIMFDINMANLDKFFDADGLGDFSNVQDAKKDDDKKAQAPVVVKKGRGRPKKEEQLQNNKEIKPKDVQEPKETKTNKKKAKEEKKEEQAFTIADSFFNQANQMPFAQAGGAQGFLESQFEMANFPSQNVNAISSVLKVPRRDSKEKISLPENNNSMNSLVKEQPEFANSNSISMMYPGYQQQQQQNDLFENFEFDFQDAEDFNFDEGTFLFEPFDETKQGEEQESTTEATSQPVRKRGRPRKYAPDGSLLVPDGSGQVRPPIKKTSKLQAEREAYEKYLEELKKPYVIHIHHDENDPEQKINLTRVGEEHQLYVPPFNINQPPAKKKNLSPLWAPDMATQEFLDSYLRRLEAVVGQKITYQGAALRVLKIYNMRVDDVLENVKISPKYYQNYFKVNQRTAKNRFAH